jgi:ribosomal protein L40E
MTDKRNLRVFCPTHEAAFEVAESPKILCEITEHTLSVGFPHSEFWEFCCNCETFTPSKLDRGEKARKICYGCGNDISKRFVCANCKIVAFECSAQTKGKSYSINANGIEPSCPGCQSLTQNGALVLHQCKESESNILTARADCPFCLEKTDASNAREKVASDANTTQVCPKCGAAKIPGAIFCGRCRYQLRTDVAVTNLGSEVNKTQLLGSLCPNCGIPISPDSGFCRECGQAVKKAIPPPPPPPPKKSPAESLTINVPASSAPDNSTRNVIIGVAGVLLLIVIAAIASNVSKSSGSSTYNSNANYTSAGNSNSARTSSGSASNSSTMNTSLSNSFQRDYQGTINGQSLSVSLVRAGRDLRGTASTSRSTDTLSGTIETDGRFKLDGYENGTRLTGIYTGQVHADGTVTGSWTTPKGSKETPFSLEQR